MKRKMWQVGVFATAWVLLMGVVSAGSPASAADNGRWAVTPTPAPGSTTQPSYFYLDAAPGQQIKASVRVSNLTDEALDLQLFGADAYNTERDGGFALRAITDSQTDLGAWVSLPTRALSLPADRQADVPFVIQVPKAATPGDHVGGIVALGPEDDEVDPGLGARIRRGVGARIYLRVAGEAKPALEVRDLAADAPFNWLPTTTDGQASFDLANVGNIALTPQTEVRASGLFGHDVGVGAPIASTSLVPGAVTTYERPLAGLWPLDLVTVKVIATAEDGTFAEQTTRTIVVPWTTLVALILLCLLVVLLTRRAARRRSATRYVVLGNDGAGPAGAPTEESLR